MTHETSGSGSSEHEEPLSATAMFLRSLEEPATAPAAPASPAPKAEAGWPAAPAQEPAQAGPGEFTRIFQAAPRQEPQRGPEASLSSGNAPAGNAPPGEFTRIFSAGVVSQEAKTVVEPPPYAPPAASAASASSRKGFSAMGVSDSASREGSVTQILKPMPQSAAPVAPLEFRAQAAQPLAPNEPLIPSPAYMPAAEASWTAEPLSPVQGAPASGPSVTSLISTLAGPGSSSPARAPEPVPYAPAPVPAYKPEPAYAPAAPPESSATPEAGSVTRLIQRLAQAPPEPPPTPAFAANTPTAPAASGPGEFTRMISAAAFAPAGAAPPQASPAKPAPAGFPAAPVFPPVPQFAMPQPGMPQIPHAQPAAPPAGLPMQMPMPAMQMPKAPAMPAPPAIAAPKGKLEGMVPLLLILNTFLLVLILVVVLFALKAH